MSKDAYTKSLEVFMQKVAEKVKCLPDYTDPANENDHILRAIDQLLETAHNSDYAKSKSCANCSKLYQCNDVRKHPEWHCEKHDFA